MKLAAGWGLVKDTVAAWLEHNPFRLGAALAFYAVFSAAPVLIITIGLAGLIFGEQAAQGQIVSQVSQIVGATAAESIQDFIRGAHQSEASGWATLFGIVAILLGATAVFGELHAALDTIWGVQPKPGRGVWGIVCDRLISFLAVLCTGVLLLLSLVITTALYTLGRYLPMLGLSDNVHLWEAINWLISLVVFTLLFAMIYKVLPDVGLAWRDVWVGAAVTALLFDIGRFLIGVYIGSSVEASAYGAAGSLVVLLLWVYYSALVFLLGAEFTFVYTQRNGRPVKPSANAEWADGRCGDPVAADMHPAARDQASAAS